MITIKREGHPDKQYVDVSDYSNDEYCFMVTWTEDGEFCYVYTSCSGVDDSTLLTVHYFIVDTAHGVIKTVRHWV